MCSRKAFSLMEIILVVVILGMLAALVAPRLFKTAEKGRVSTAMAQIAYFKTALTEFETTGAYYPSTAEGLAALVAKPANWPEGAQWRRFLDGQTIPLDPWNRPYVYRCPGTVNTDGYDLFSSGPDGSERTDDDIGNTQ